MTKAKNKEILDLIKKFPIGTAVNVDRVMVRRRYGNQRSHICWESVVNAPFEAWIVGATWVCNGNVVRSTYGEDQSYMKVGNKFPVFIVRRAMFSKQILVPAEGIIDKTLNGRRILLTEACPMNVSYSWSEKDREFLRKEMQSVPRDAKGRWVKVKHG